VNLFHNKEVPSVPPSECLFLILSGYKHVANLKFGQTVTQVCADHKTMVCIGHPRGGVAGLVGIEGGVVSGLSNPNDSGVATPVETTPWQRD